MVKEFKSVYAKQETINTQKHVIPKRSPANFSILLYQFFPLVLFIVHISAEDGLYCPLQIRHLDLDLLQKATNLGRFKKKELEKKYIKSL